MAAAKQNFTIDQGSDWAQPLLWKDEDLVAIDTSTYTARMHIRENIEDALPLITLETNPKPGGGAGNGRITLGIVEETAGVAAYNILLEIENAASDDLPAGKWPYDLEMVGASGDVTRLIYGKVKVRREVTR